MIRDHKLVRVSVIIAMIVATTALTTIAAHAGDSDGVLGYSMKLKNRTITTGETGGSGDGLISGTDLYTKQAYQTPTSIAQYRLPITVPLSFYRYIPSWSWVFLQPR
jgi:hypothetical protein